MKIAFILTSFNVGGLERVFVTLANAFSCDNDVSLIVCNNTGELASLVNYNVKIIDLGGIRIKQLFYPLRKCLQKNQFDILVSGGDWVNSIVGLTSFFTSVKTKIVMTQHNFFNSEFVYILNKGFTRYLMSLLYKRAHKVVAVSSSIKNFCVNDLNCSNVIVIPNPVEIKKEKEYIVNYTLPEKYVIFIGRLSVVKNIPLILRAMKVLHDKNESIPLLILGSGNEEEKLKKKVKDLGIENNVLFLGSVSNIFPYLERAELLLLTSTSEAFPVVILEALSLGIPVISTKTEGPLEIMSDLEANYFIDSFNDEYELAQKITFVLKTNIDREELIHCSEKYNIVTIKKKYNELFSSLMNNIK